MSVLTLIQSHCKRHALAVPTAVVGTADVTVKQLLETLIETVDEIVTEAKFNVTTLEATFTAVAAESQGALTTLAASGFQYIVNDTIWNRTKKLPLYGPLDEAEWQSRKAIAYAGPSYAYRIRGGLLLFNPVPAAPLPTIAFEYVSSWGVTSAAGAAKAAITLDTDLFLFPDNILKKGPAFRWKRDKGLPYQADEAAYYDLLNKYVSRDKTKRAVNVAGWGDKSAQPMIVVASGSWLQ